MMTGVPGPTAALDAAPPPQEATECDVALEEAGPLSGDAPALESRLNHISRVKYFLNDLLTLPGTCAVRHSVWDAALLCGLPQLGPGNSVAVAAAVAVNLFAQVIFCWKVFESTVDRVAIVRRRAWGFRLWRETVGHDVRWMDRNQASLVSRVCSLDTSLHISGRQLEDYRDIKEYQQQNLGLFVFLPLLIWFCYVGADVLQALEVLKAWKHLPMGALTVLVPDDNSNGRFVFVQASRMRNRAAVLFTIARLGIAIFLGFTGALFVTSTINLEAIRAAKRGWGEGPRQPTHEAERLDPCAEHFLNVDECCSSNGAVRSEAPVSPLTSSPLCPPKLWRAHRALTSVGGARRALAAASRTLTALTMVLDNHYGGHQHGRVSRPLLRTMLIPLLMLFVVGVALVCLYGMYGGGGWIPAGNPTVFGDVANMCI
eukprot:gene56871-biopygen76206